MGSGHKVALMRGGYVDAGLDSRYFDRTSKLLSISMSTSKLSGFISVVLNEHRVQQMRTLSVQTSVNHINHGVQIIQAKECLFDDLFGRLKVEAPLQVVTQGGRR